MLVLKTVIYKSKLLDFQYYASLILDVFYTPLIKTTSLLKDTIYLNSQFHKAKIITFIVTIEVEAILTKKSC